MFHSRRLAALAAVTATLALAVPAVSASAAPTAPAVRTASIGVGLQSGSLPCRILVHEIQRALLLGHKVWANYLSNVFVYSHCGGAAI